MTIVCVDDHPILLKGLKHNVHQIMPEASIHTFESADKALDFVKDGGCDVLITEIEMQAMSGLTLARKTQTLNPEVNIIFLTVCDASEYAREVLEIRPSGYLLKPADETRLAFELRNLRYRVC